MASARQMNVQKGRWGHIPRWLAAALLACPCVIRAQQTEPPTFTATLDASTGNIGINGFATSYATTLSPSLSGIVPLPHGMQLSGLVTGSVSRFESGNLTNYLVGDIAVNFDTTSLSKPSLYVESSVATYLRNAEGNYFMTGVRWGHTDGTGGGSIPIGSAFEDALLFGAWGSFDISRTHADYVHILNIPLDQRQLIDTLSPTIAHNGYYIQQQQQYNTERVEGGLSARWRTLTAVTSVDLNSLSSTTYIDVTAGGTWHPAANVQVRATSGFRIGPPHIGGGVGGQRAWSDLSVMLPLVGHNALIVSAGSALADPERATLGAKYVSVSTRWMLGSIHRSTPLSRMVAELNRSTVAGDVNADGSRTLTIVLPTAHTVDLIGDFTGWRQITMTRAPNGVWHARVALSPGSHRMNVRVDAGPWQAPPGLPVAPDDFGGLVGLLVIH